MHVVHLAADQDLHDLLRAVSSDALDDGAYLDDLDNLASVMDQRDADIAEQIGAQDDDAAFERWLANMTVRSGRRTRAAVSRARV